MTVQKQLMSFKIFVKQEALSVEGQLPACPSDKFEQVSGGAGTGRPELGGPVMIAGPGVLMWTSLIRSAVGAYPSVNRKRTLLSRNFIGWRHKANGKNTNLIRSLQITTDFTSDWDVYLRYIHSPDLILWKCFWRTKVIEVRSEAHHCASLYLKTLPGSRAQTTQGVGRFA